MAHSIINQWVDYTLLIETLLFVIFDISLYFMQDKTHNGLCFLEISLTLSMFGGTCSVSIEHLIGLIEISLTIHGSLS